MNDDSDAVAHPSVASAEVNDGETRHEAELVPTVVATDTTPIDLSESVKDAVLSVHVKEEIAALKVGGEGLEKGQESERGIDEISTSDNINVVSPTVGKIIEPIPITPVAPSPLLSTVPLSGAPTATSTSLPTLSTHAIRPVTPSISPAPAKKFASSLSVNKKFLEKAGEKGKVEVKSVPVRPVPIVVSTISASILTSSHPRLLTGKIASTPTSSSLTSAQANAGVSGWLKTLPVDGLAPRPSLPPQTMPGRPMGGGTYERGAMRGMGRGGREDAVWGHRAGGSQGMNMGIGGDFPTAAEAANAKIARAAAIIEQAQSRERAIQARIALAAATNAHLLEGLDAFRGIHLDPNASHWDDMGDEEDNFLDETIEFADGTQYKIDAEVVSHPEDGSTATRRYDGAYDPDDEDLATVEAPLAEGELNHEPNRGERFQDDYDRTWQQRPAGDAKTLFNDRLGKLEPYASSSRKSIPGTILVPQVEDSNGPRARRESITSPRLSQATIPTPVTGAWGRDNNVARSSQDWSQGGGAGSGPTARRPTFEQQGRQLPPHLIGTVPAPRRPSQDVSSHRQPPPHQASAPSPTITARPSALVVSPTISHSTLPSISAALESAAPVASSAAPAVLDVNTVHAQTMHAAAERARKRKQEEEDVIAEREVRMRKKAADLAAAAGETVTLIQPRRDSVVSPISPTTPTAESWRERQTRTIAQVQPPAPPISVKVEPTAILARQPSLSAASTSVPVSTPSVPRPSVETKFIPATRAVSTSTAIPTGPRADQRQLPTGPRLPSNPRQPPPHLAQRTTRVPLAPHATLAPSTTLDASAIHLDAAPVSPVVSSRGLAVKVPEIAALDDLMSRIKGAMTIPAELTADAAETISRSESVAPSETVVATVRLPRSASKSIPPPSTTSPVVTPVANRGRLETRKQSLSSRQIVTPVPTFIDRDHVLSFDTSRAERSQSPPPAWKAYVVRLATYPPLRLPHHKLMKGFFNSLVPVRVAALHWEPPLTLTGAARVSRDEYIFPPARANGARKGANNSSAVIVKIPNRRSIAATLRMLAAAEDELVSVREQERLGLAKNGDVDIRMRSALDQSSSSRSQKQVNRVSPSAAGEGTNGTTAPPTADLFEEKESTAVPISSLPGSRRATPSVSELERHTELKTESSRKFMNAGGRNASEKVDGEVVEQILRESLAAPLVADAIGTIPVKSPEVAPTESLPLASTWSAATVPLSSSLVVDPMSSSLWSAPPTDSARSHTRAVSAEGIQQDRPLRSYVHAEIQATMRPETDIVREEPLGSEARVTSELRAVAPSYDQSLPQVPSASSYQDPCQVLYTRQQIQSQYATLPSSSSNYPSAQPFTSPSPSHYGSTIPAQSQPSYPMYAAQQPSLQQPSYYPSYPSTSPFPISSPSTSSSYSPYRSTSTSGLIGQGGYGSPMHNGTIGAYGAIGGRGGTMQQPSFGVRNTMSSSSSLPYGGVSGYGISNGGVGSGYGGGYGGGGGGMTSLPTSASYSTSPNMSYQQEQDAILYNSQQAHFANAGIIPTGGRMMSNGGMRNQPPQQQQQQQQSSQSRHWS